MSDDLDWRDAEGAILSTCDRLGVTYDHRSRGTLLIERKMVENVLRELVSDGYFILGLEGFELDGPLIRPRLDLIYDGSTATGPEPAFEALALFDDSVWVDITLGRSSDIPRR